MEHEFPSDSILKDSKEFKFPANIKQMGNADRDLKIYLEDYVYTYLYQFARSGGGGEKLAVLVGKHQEVDGVDVCEISGAIEGRHTESFGDKISFTEESWNYINRQLEIYFKGLCIIGWAHIQPDFGTYVIPSDAAFHRECFKESWQLLFVMDPGERLDAFYCMPPRELSLRTVRGYFIYYDKNETMQNYMIENSLIKPKVVSDFEEEPPKESGKAAVARLLGITRHKEESVSFCAKEGKEKPLERVDAAKRIRKVLNEKAEEKEKEMHNRQVVLTAICAALCLASVLMSGNLLNNRTRIKNLETELVTMKSSYETMNKTFEEKAAQVFAAQIVKQEEIKEDKDIKEETPEPETEEKPSVDEEEVQTQNMKIYVVEDGDSLLYISRKFYGSGEKVSEIMKINNLSNENVIYSGERLLLP